MRPWTLAALLLISAHAADAAAEPSASEAHWLDCSRFQRADGGIEFVDRWGTVFFEPGKAEITATYVRLLDYHATQTDDPPGCRVVIEGHSDLSEAASGDLSLSRRRAEAVAAYLRRRGVHSPIEVRASGGSRPLVETANGVSEPQNRYVQLWVVGADES